MEAGDVEQAQEAGPAILPLRTHDLVLCLAATLAAAILVFYGREQVGWKKAALVFSGVAASPLAFRALERRWPTLVTRFLATFLPPTVGIVLIYSNLNPLCDLINPHLVDPRLAHLDQLIFGVHPSVWLDRVLPPWAIEPLFFCYISYYVWPVGIALILFAQGEARRRDLERFILGYVIFMLGTYVCYLALPAIGPRFYLAAEFTGPLRGGSLVPALDQMFRDSPYFRDCFPSGHTGLTLFCLFSAYVLTRRFFWVMLLPGLGLIAATVVCRFHYGVDLLAAPAFTAFALAAAEMLDRRVPDGLVLRRFTRLRPLQP